MKFVRFGNCAVNMDLVTQITVWDDNTADLFFAVLSSDGGRAFTRLRGGDVITLRHWLEDNSENGRTTMRAISTASWSASDVHT